jgi:hypothetical protein
LAVCAEAAKEKDLNNNRIHNILRLALYSAFVLDVDFRLMAWDLSFYEDIHLNMNCLTLAGGGSR